MSLCLRSPIMHPGKPEVVTSPGQDAQTIAAG